MISFLAQEVSRWKESRIQDFDGMLVGAHRLLHFPTPFCLHCLLEPLHQKLLDCDMMTLHSSCYQEFQFRVQQ